VINEHRPTYSEKTQTACPRCTSGAIHVLPENNPGSHQEWFRCGDCDHMWSQRRDRREQGEPRLRQPPREREGDGA
jgi:transposase-like protein